MKISKVPYPFLDKVYEDFFTTIKLFLNVGCNLISTFSINLFTWKFSFNLTNNFHSWLLLVSILSLFKLVFGINLPLWIPIDNFKFI